MARLGHRMRLFDMRVDVPVPAVMAVVERLDGGLGTPCFAVGAGLDPVGRCALPSRRRRPASRGWTSGSRRSCRPCARWPPTTARCTSSRTTPCCTACRRRPRRPTLLLNAAPPRSMDELYGRGSRRRLGLRSADRERGNGGLCGGVPRFFHDARLTSRRELNGLRPVFTPSGNGDRLTVTALTPAR
ncbi:hypothetical protein BU197_19150 [Streptomyces sp. CBMA291]|nr:hypothetical protein [Streptomyces sp. CBMA291]MBD0712749.1 hypothetical protein [Streptomyces sp. CBMA370]